MKKLLFLFLLGFPMFSFVSAHKFYVSVTEMEYRPEKNSLQIISRVFIDDFENVLKARCNKDLFLTAEKEHKNAEAFVERYVNEKLKVKINGEFQNLNYLGKEFKDDMVLMYIEIEDVPNFDEIEVSNTLLFDLFPDQKNIVHVKLRNETKSLLLMRDNEEGSLNF